jgi:S-adenosylmethionine uptake transporter
MSARSNTVSIEPASGLIDAPGRGIFLIAFGIGIFSVQDIIIRSLGSTYPALEIMFVRGLVAMCLIGVMVYLDGWFSTLRMRHPVLNIVRGLLQVSSYTAYYMAMAAMPIAEVTAIFFISPLVVTLFSALFLGETVGIRRWSAVLVGFAGVLVIVRPGAAVLDPVALLPLLASFTYATSVIITRRIGRTQTGSSLAFIAMSVFIVVSALAGAVMGDGRFADESHASLAFLLRGWSVPEGGDILLISACGLVAAFGFYCLAQGYRIAPASVVAPFEFVAMPLAVFWGIVVWAEYPSPATLLGITLIVCSGIYVLNREAVRKRPISTGRGIRLRL